MANILDNILSMLNFGGVIKNTLTKGGVGQREDCYIYYSILTHLLNCTFIRIIIFYNAMKGGQGGYYIAIPISKYTIFFF